MKKIVAVTSCPTGIAHTYMASESLEEAAKKMDVQMKVETQGSVGVENELSEQDIKEADAVIIAADTNVSHERFGGKSIVEVAVADAIDDAESLINQALEKAEKGEKTEVNANLNSQVSDEKSKRKAKRSGPYKHLMTGVSFMLPFVVAGGLSIALSFVFGINAAEQEGSLAAALMQIGGDSAFALMVPILAGYIAFSIADRPGIAPGMIGGMLASSIGAGFLGGIIAGFLAGYVTQWLKENIKLPENLQGLMPVLVLPFLSSLIIGLLMIYLIGPPVEGIMNGLESWLQGMTDANAVLLGLILGAMMAFDMGGPVNKAAYTFSVGLLGSEIYGPMAAVMAAGMTPPLGLALATVLFKNRFTNQEIEAGKPAWFMGISFITEGAIPFAAADPIRVIPSIMTGSAITGALSMLFGVGLRAPHGGIFVLPIPNVVTNLGFYALAIIAGTIVTTFMLRILKPKLAE
ncbi:PTS system D-fructose-specific IIB component (F1P-forming) (Frc family) /PTS system D-fructose-specific IIC component (F1P-forming) (Frc family) [Halanaerobium saccharolyticum]|uniref:PTS system D-fructose-specific IIB component (F1P-forming) (Frc family) /PTS system D-fructose-specific IIC component (F1P-forming) (Frc family) n=1 Tax=Halanaerobium saccharolyticum TaxID=43595 RepID=A0A4R6LPR8_9FIRM|nr:fructose-specific PTS transporter subunit EIIC [Halanaerobium saccharolyticum]TDO86496.1 PTS system D-fructose-specific IIB component (F1P-forming) (Frc family) /PTS system D-fructose-specific IIC component (F1P-forming) (Frc family) [Halanaerobium saccharolyticum]